MTDRILMIALIAGVWALALKPLTLEAHSGQECEIQGTGYGEIDGEEVYVYEITGTAYCS